MHDLIEKLNSSVQYLENDIPFNIDKYSIKLIDDVVEVNCYSLFRDLNYYTDNIAIKELGEAKDNFIVLMNQSFDFKNYVTNKKIKFSLLMDYGKGAVLIAND